MYEEISKWFILLCGKTEQAIIILPTSNLTEIQNLSTDLPTRRIFIPCVSLIWQDLIEVLSIEFLSIEFLG